MNRSPTIAAARFSSLVPAPIHPMQARLLALVAAHRFATTTQLARLTALEYASPASALRQTQRHLASLAQQRLLTSLERRVGGWQGGSAVTIWAATTRGHRLVAADEGEEVPRRQRPREVSTTFLDHLLAITEVRTGIEEAVRQEANTEAAVALEPDCWRTALSPSGQVQVLRSDLAVTITSPAYEDRYLVEVDRATENPGRSSPPAGATRNTKPRSATATSSPWWSGWSPPTADATAWSEPSPTAPACCASSSASSASTSCPP